MPRTALVGLAAILASQLACGPTGDPFPVDVAIEPASLEITIPPATYVSPPQFAELRVTNVLGSNLYLSAAYDRADGDLADLLIVELPQRLIELPAFTVVEPGRTTLLRVTLNQQHWRWIPGDHQVKLPLEIRYFWSGQAIDEPEQPSDRRAPEPVADLRTLTVNFSIDCDLDADTFIAVECGGDDCNDADDEVFPGAEETCDRVDRDCDGATTDFAVDARGYFLDLDRDTYGDDATEVQACGAPDGRNWVNRGGDCDDEDANVKPTAREFCSDGIDNDCDDLVDAADVADCGT